MNREVEEIDIITPNDLPNGERFYLRITRGRCEVVRELATGTTNRPVLHLEDSAEPNPSKEKTSVDWSRNGF